MAPEIAPDPKEQAVPLNTLEVRFTGGMLALNRFLMTLQNKRMPVAGFTVGRDADGMRATILLDCAPEMARRYTMLLSNLEDVQGVTPADEGVEVALLYTNGDWRESAERNGIKAHESDGTVVASGGPEALESWLSELGDEVEDIVRLGPMVRPGNGGT
ncbi:MAG TPA: hypothetical protein VFE21_02160 [Rubrobacteraceae bacterium]|nr:hypothetical protein [Rubrobacteraceae bacterium]